MFNLVYLYVDLQLDDAVLQNYALVEIEKLLQRNGGSLKTNKSMPYRDEALIMEQHNRLIQDELNYDRSQLSLDHDRLVSSFTDEQRGVYDQIMCVVSADKGGCFFFMDTVEQERLLYGDPFRLV